MSAHREPGGPADPGKPSDPRTIWLAHHLATAALRRVVEAFDEAGIVALPVKGIVTARLLYEDVALRPIRDVDVRLRGRDLGLARRVAGARGWTWDARGPRLHEAVMTVDGWQFDLECALGPPGLCAIGVDALVSRARRHVEPLGFAHLEPELHDHALVLVLNAFKDGLAGVPWSLEDLRRIVRVDRFDPAALVARAREGRVLSALWIVADWLITEKDAEGWRPIRDSIGPRPPSARVAAVYRFALRRGWPPKPGLFVSASSSDDPWRGARGLGLAAAGILAGRAHRSERG